MIVAGNAGETPRSLPGTTVILASDNPEAPTAPAPPDHRPNAFPELLGEVRASSEKFPGPSPRCVLLYVSGLPYCCCSPRSLLIAESVVLGMLLPCQPVTQECRSFCSAYLLTAMASAGHQHAVQ